MADPMARDPDALASAGPWPDAVWLDAPARHCPGLIDGTSRGDLLALQSDPDLSRQIMGALAADNGGIASQDGSANKLY
jgi:hypothetical protein